MTEPQASRPGFLPWALLPPTAPESSGCGLRSHPRPPGGSMHVPSVPTQGARASAGKAPPICPTKPSRTELLEQEFQQLLPALLRRDVISVFIFLDNCHGFATTDEVLDLLFTK